MTEILQSPSQISSSPSSIRCVVTRTSNDYDGLHQQSQTHLFNCPEPVDRRVEEEEEEEFEERESRERKEEREREEGDQISVLEVLVTVLRKSLIGGCRKGRVEEFCTMEVGCPTNVRHVAHVTFDRFNGFLGLPVEFEPEVPRRPPSASTSVFGVSTECMQLSFDSRGNSVPTILLMMQRRLYAQEGLQAEGIFRINAENSQEEYVREQLNTGVVPDNIDVHCLAGLIKAWFRELPNGLLDLLPPEEVMQAQSEEECVELVRRLPPTEAALLDWAINLMADVAQLEHLNKMNARNIAMVFAPNMTHMADPLTALMHAVQVMNFLKTLIVRTLKEREDSVFDHDRPSHIEPSDENGDHRSSRPAIEDADKANKVEEQVFVTNEPLSESPSRLTANDLTTEHGAHSCLNSIENIIPSEKGRLVEKVEEVEEAASTGLSGRTQHNIQKKKIGQSSNTSLKKGQKRGGEGTRQVEKNKGTSIISQLNSRTERVETWR
ncbi:hypothetical protein NMG60_11001471 [Bertholletia excelsa]